ncbi:transposase [Thermodesulfobacteriota bacterium]
MRKQIGKWTVTDFHHLPKDSEDVVFVGDRGMVKRKGKEALNQEGFTYITALTNPQARKLLKEGIIQLELFDETVCEIQNGHVRLVLRRNDRVRYRERTRREDKLTRLRELVDERNEFVMKSRRADPEAGIRKLTRWAKRYKISTFVCLSLDDRRIEMSVDEEAKTSAGLLDGCYVLETDVCRERMEARLVDERYRSLHLVERNFRTLKTGLLELRPVFVRKAERTERHAFAAMLALKIVREAESLLARAFAPDRQGHGESLLENALGTLSGFSFNL